MAENPPCPAYIGAGSGGFAARQRHARAMPLAFQVAHNRLGGSRERCRLGWVVHSLPIPAFCVDSTILGSTLDFRRFFSRRRRVDPSASTAASASRISSSLLWLDVDSRRPATSGARSRGFACGSAALGAPDRCSAPTCSQPPASRSRLSRRPRRAGQIAALPGLLRLRDRGALRYAQGTARFRGRAQPLAVVPCAPVSTWRPRCRVCASAASWCRTQRCAWAAQR